MFYKRWQFKKTKNPFVKDPIAINNLTQYLIGIKKYVPLKSDHGISNPWLYQLKLNKSNCWKYVWILHPNVIKHSLPFINPDCS